MSGPTWAYCLRIRMERPSLRRWRRPRDEMSEAASRDDVRQRARLCGRSVEQTQVR